MRFPAEADWSKRLQLVRTMKNQTQQDVADILGTCRRQIYRWEKGLHEPDAYSRKKLAAWANEPEEILFKGLKGRK